MGRTGRGENKKEVDSGQRRGWPEMVTAAGMETCADVTTTGKRMAAGGPRLTPQFMAHKTGRIVMP